jgi:S1-C subfamily serine protease
MSLKVLLGAALLLGGTVLAQQGQQAGRQKEAVLGAGTRAPTGEEVKEFSLPSNKRPQGQVVESLDAGGPAEKAGVAKGDIFLTFDGSKLYSRDALEDLLRASMPGSEVKVLLKRAKTYREEEVQIKLGERDAARKGIVWDHAGIEHLDGAMAQAKKEGKTVLVGLSGAET